MKKIILFLISAVLTISCEYRSDEEIKEAERLSGFNTIVIDSCEYLMRKSDRGYQGYGFFGHKGNCSFCKERDSIKWEKRKKELEELLKKN